jgi:hypothetical protein
MWKSPRLEMYEEGKDDQARHLELDSVEELRCNALYSQLATYKASNTSTTATYRRGPSTSTIWSSIASKTRQGFTSSTHDGTGP